MELRTLRYFLAVAREENMTEAANVLHVTQPTLSRQIGDLERELGVELFERTNRSCVLTSDGMRLRQRAEEIISLVEQTEGELADRELGIAGNIRIGAGETRAMQVVLGAFADVRRDYQGATCELYTGNADAVEERLERGLLDFALVLEPVNLEKYEWIRMPDANQVGLTVSADGPWGVLEVATPADVAKMPLLISSRTSNKAVDLVSWSGGAFSFDELDVVGSFDLIGNASHLVRSGVACAMGIDHLLQVDDASDLRFVPLEPSLKIASFVIWKKYRLRSRACEEFLRRLELAVRE